MKNGSKPLKKQPKRQFADYFGGSVMVPDFELDSGLWNPNQEADNKPTECTSYHVADTFTDLLKKQCVPGFTFGATTFVENISPTTAGADPLAALQSSVIAGVLTSDHNAQPQTEIMDANWSNWAEYQRTAALQNVAVDVHNALGFTDAFNSIISTMWTGQVSVALCTPFYREWLEGTGSDGIMPMPDNVSDVSNLPYHCWSAKGQKTINGKTYIIGKTWIGPSFGDKGFSYISQDVLNPVLSLAGTGALVMVMTGQRFVPLVRITLQHLNVIPYVLPQLLSLSNDH